MPTTMKKFSVDDTPVEVARTDGTQAKTVIMNGTSEVAAETATTGLMIAISSTGQTIADDLMSVVIAIDGIYEVPDHFAGIITVRRKTAAAAETVFVTSTWTS